MLVRALRSSPVRTAHPWTPVKVAAAILSAHGFTALPVVDEDERLAGIVTEADLICDRVPAEVRTRHREPVGPGTIDTTVGAVMTAPAIAMTPGTDAAELCRALADERIRAIPVVGNARVVGIVTRGDVVRVLARHDQKIAVDVRHRLGIYGGPGRWRTEVRDGIVHIVDHGSNRGSNSGNGTDHHAATLLALAVPGAHAADTGSADEEAGS
ncbi:CBS domain-containing protein [Amycolatopsis sp. PS_44_ISF1]|uniref:CBS domain-containing protein n=1 Tax=Amycolatopsis sp. PS_44_ISF1 TaxID=2974917 RepID=UPI0028DFF585|nr:CBS domain-containing protein [Amycolatopsis sp. PS_44_ISF1]MDT8913661.1 CBS domain-containing protein [Amycolatopsis sp. PS_44_ISF1]